MIDEHAEALKALMEVFDRRLAAGPVVERRANDRGEKVVEAERTDGPAGGDFAYWRSPANRGRIVPHE